MMKGGAQIVRVTITYICDYETCMRLIQLGIMANRAIKDHEKKRKRRNKKDRRKESRK